MADDRFQRHMDKPAAMIAMTDVWAAKRKNRDIRNAELKRKVPTGWTEGVEGSAHVTGGNACSDKKEISYRR